MWLCYINDFVKVKNYYLEYVNFYRESMIIKISCNIIIDFKFFFFGCRGGVKGRSKRVSNSGF